MPRIDTESLAEGVAYLTAADSDLARLTTAYGPPPIWGRPPGFPTLVHIILEQQVSLASAAAAFDKLAAAGDVVPSRFLSYSDAALKKFGFSRQKAAYCRGLSEAVLDGSFDLAGLELLPDAVVREQLIGLKGIGPWTADIYLLMALRRPDVWPPGDLALLKALKQVKQLPAIPDKTTFIEIGEPWRPWRAVAARMLWHYSLSQR